MKMKMAVGLIRTGPGSTITHSILRPPPPFLIILLSPVSFFFVPQSIKNQQFSIHSSTLPLSLPLSLSLSALFFLHKLFRFYVLLSICFLDDAYLNNKSNKT
ncbi:hypothetical protein PGT21_006922 [Puccinia graminis f. sp. tritici]|uniref:Uncharacterized protein n=1 Tax=Puccinia graminis f. sp. tritici TaxID=56615 RepID=A0A5B0MDG4_PUCGR|nr:hypothetical protein PGTUg99_028236 [Puccinia graminis f. sp. tritici]KAA1090611.1 hypothetical protein PGT21_006922 [Puccinia graminis f. sp. tritici]